MKTKITFRKIVADRSLDPSKIAGIVEEADMMNLPQGIMKTASDVVATIIHNTPKSDYAYSIAEPVASYLLKYAYALNQAGELTLAPPKPKGGQK